MDSVPPEPRVLHPGDPEAQALARAIASPTAGEIIQVLGEEPMTASALAARLGIPITTAAYHLDHLVGAGVIEVTGTRWSRKGREQKVYRLVDRVVIVSPGREDLRSLLRKYATLGLALCGTALLAGVLGSWSAPKAAFRTASEGNGAGAVPVSAPADATVGATAADPGTVAMYVLLGGLAVILALVLYDAYRARRNG
jgi:DNA-binding transcriptional ArsR family regulator